MSNNVGISNFLIQNFLSNGENNLSNFENINATNIFGELLEKFNLPNIVTVAESHKLEAGTNLLNTIEISSKQVNDFIDYSNIVQSNLSSQTMSFEDISSYDILAQTTPPFEDVPFHNIFSEEMLINNLSSEVIPSQNIFAKDELSHNIASDNLSMDIEKLSNVNYDVFGEKIKATINNNEEVLAEIETTKDYFSEEEVNETAPSECETDNSSTHPLSIQNHLDDNADSNENTQKSYVEELKFNEKKYSASDSFILDEKENTSFAKNSDDNSNESKINEIFHEENYLKKIEITPQKVALNYKKFEHMHDAKSVIEQLKINLNKLTPESNRITIKLSPEELGSIEVIVNFDSQSIKGIEMKIEKVDTYNLLQKDTNNLKTALNGLGFEFNDSTLNFNLEHNNRDKNHNFGEDLSQNQSKETIDITDKIATNYLPKELGRVDILA